MQPFAAGDETTVLIQIGFIGAVLFLILYTYWHNWWETTHGIVLSTLAMALVIVFLHRVLLYWHLVGHAPGADKAWDWIGTQALLGPLAWLVLCWQLVRRNRDTLMQGLRNPGSMFTAWQRRFRDSEDQDTDPWDPRNDLTPSRQTSPPE